VLGVIDEWTPERLREVGDSLREYLTRIAHDQRALPVGCGLSAGRLGEARPQTDPADRLLRVFHARAVFS
jgi:hypothetical protein